MWDDAFPSFLIGLREGLEAGLIVSVLIATLVRSGARSRLPQVWTGVLAAISLALSFGAVLTFTAASLSATAQEAFGGALSVVAVGFVTAMVFWMRRSARTLSREIREKVTGAPGRASRPGRPAARTRSSVSSGCSSSSGTGSRCPNRS